MEDKRRGKIGEKRKKNEQTVGFLAEKLPQNEQSEATEILQHKNRYKKNNQPRQRGKADYLQFFTGNYLLINPQTD